MSANAMRDIQRVLEQTTGRAPAAAATEAPAQPEKVPVPPSRVGKTHIGAYLNPDFKRSIRMVQAATGEDLQQILVRALNDVFRAHNVPVVDQD